MVISYMYVHLQVTVGNINPIAMPLEIQVVTMYIGTVCTVDITYSYVY